MYESVLCVHRSTVPSQHVLIEFGWIITARYMICFHCLCGFHKLILNQSNEIIANLSLKAQILQLHNISLNAFNLIRSEFHYPSSRRHDGKQQQKMTEFIVRL